MKTSNGSTSQTQILSNLSNSSYVTHRQTDRQTASFSHDFSWTIFFHGEKKDPKSGGISIFCSFLFFIRNTRDEHDSVIFLLLVAQVSELSQKYDYPLLIVPVLINFLSIRFLSRDE